MSGIFALLIKLLPLIMPIIAAIFGGFAQASYTEIHQQGGAEALLSATGAQYVGGNLAGVIGSLAAAWWGYTKRLAMAQQEATGSITTDRMLTAFGITNITAAFQLLGRVIVLIKGDKEASALFDKLFGFSPSSVPTEADALARKMAQAS